MKSGRLQCERRAQLRPFCLAAIGRPHIADEALVARRVLAQHDRRLGDTSLVAQQRLDFTELHAIATDLDLLVAAAQALDAAVRQESSQVARAVHARWPSPGSEALRRELRPLPVAARDAQHRRSPARRASPAAAAAAVVEHVHRLVQQRRADRNAVGRRDGDVIHRPTVDQIVVSVGPYMLLTRPLHQCRQSSRQIRRQRLAAHHHVFRGRRGRAAHRHRRPASSPWSACTGSASRTALRSRPASEWSALRLAALCASARSWSRYGRCSSTMSVRDAEVDQAGDLVDVGAFDALDHLQAVLRRAEQSAGRGSSAGTRTPADRPCPGRRYRRRTHRASCPARPTAS